MIECLGAWRPSEEVPMIKQADKDRWEIEEPDPGNGGYSSYVV